MSASNGANGRQSTATAEPDRMRIAAELRFARPELAWDDIAAHLGVNPSTLWRWRKTEAWEIIHRDVATRYVNDLIGDAIQALRKAWKRGNPTGAIDVLRSFALLKAQELNVSTTRALDDEIAGILADLAPTGPDPQRSGEVPAALAPEGPA